MTDPCPYCGSPTEIRDSAIVYGKSYGGVLICSRYPACDSFVGIHRGTNRPKGTLANANLRAFRKAAHASFDPLWRDRTMSRSDAYRWLSRQTGIPVEACHIGMMDIEQCAKVLAVCRARRP